MINTTRDLSTLDVAGLADALGIIRARPREGMVWIECPWEQEHSSYTGDGETALFAPDARYVWPGFRCLHEHCSHRGIRDFIGHVDDKSPGLVDRFCGKRKAERGGGRGTRKRGHVPFPAPV